MSFVFLTGILSVFFLNLIFILKRRFDYVFFVYLALLPLYITGLSFIYKSTSERYVVQVCQFSKEVLLYIIPAFALIFSFITGKAKLYFATLDKWMLIYFCFVFLFLFLPQGGEMGVRIGAFRSLVALSFAYLCGRLTTFSNKQKEWIFYSLAIIAFLSGLIAFVEYLSQNSIHEFSGYPKLLSDFYNMPSSGHYGLTWTFETENGIRRFSSFFSDPLEFSASLLLVLPSIFIFLSGKNIGIKKYLLRGALLFGVIGLFTTVSRASIIAFVIQIIVIFYHLTTRKRNFVFFIIALTLGLTVFAVIASEGIMQMMSDTITFRNASSLGHLIEWLKALESIMSNPFGIGLGTSGNVAAQNEGDAVGGENQYLIIAVQIGLIGLALYLIILGISIASSLRIYNENKEGLNGKLALLAAIAKIGLLLPLFTANLELYSFVSYLSWWLVGYVTKTGLSDADRN
jgi:hypothetical protein